MPSQLHQLHLAVAKQISPPSGKAIRAPLGEPCLPQVPIGNEIGAKRTPGTGTPHILGPMTVERAQDIGGPCGHHLDTRPALAYEVIQPGILDQLRIVHEEKVQVIRLHQPGDGIYLDHFIDGSAPGYG